MFGRNVQGMMEAVYSLKMYEQLKTWKLSDVSVTGHVQKVTYFNKLMMFLLSNCSTVTSLKNI